MVVGGESGSWHYDICEARSHYPFIDTTILFSWQVWRLWSRRLAIFKSDPLAAFSIWPSCCFFVPSAALGTKKQQEGPIWIGLGSPMIIEQSVRCDGLSLPPCWECPPSHCACALLNYLHSKYFHFIGTTWVGSQTHLGWFTKSISNKYQIREIVKLKVGDVINPNNATDDIRTINTSYDKGNFILCVPTYSTELGSTQPQGTKELTPEGNTILYEEIWKYTTNL